MSSQIESFDGKLPDTPVLVRQALGIMRSRKIRYRFFDADLLIETGWDVLIYCFIQEELNTQLDLDFIAIELGTSASTLSRWVAVLRQKGLIESESLILTRKGRSQMEGFLRQNMEVITPAPI